MTDKNRTEKYTIPVTVLVPVTVDYFDPPNDGCTRRVHYGDPVMPELPNRSVVKDAIYNVGVMLNGDMIAERNE